MELGSGEILMNGSRESDDDEKAIINNEDDELSGKPYR